MSLIDVSHTIDDRMTTFKGLPARSSATTTGETAEELVAAGEA